MLKIIIYLIANYQSLQILLKIKESNQNIYLFFSFLVKKH